MKSSFRLPARLTFLFVVPVVLIVLLSALGQRRLAQPGVYEGENLVNSGKAHVNGGSVAAQPMSGFGSGWSGNAQLFWGGGLARGGA